MKLIKIGDVAKSIVSGGTPKSTKSEYYNGNIPWLNTKEINFNRIYDTEKHITKEGLNNSSAKYIKENCVIIAMYGATAGRVAINKIPLTTNQACCNIEVDPTKMDYNYLYYAIKNDWEHLASLANGGAQQNLNSLIIKEFEIPYVDMTKQKKISKILTSIDSKIELNNEINNNLYKLSKQLLLKYLDENNDSKEINIGELLNVFTGKRNANETSPNGKYKFFSCAPGNLLSDTYIYDGAAIIVAGNGAYTGRTRFYDGKFELYQRTYGLTLKDNLDINNIYGLYLFMKTVFEPDKMGGTHGSAIPYIVLSDLVNYKLKYNKTEFDRFSDLVSNNIKMIQENEKSNEELSKLRDTLLPKLMNDEINLDNIDI